MTGLRPAAAALAVSLLAVACQDTPTEAHHASPPPRVPASQAALGGPTTAATPTEEAYPAPPSDEPVGPGLPAVVNRVPTIDPVVFVTIDDGWAHDPSVLPFLADHHIVVTAFLIGRMARRDPAYWQALVAQGGLVEDHTETHPALARRTLAAQAAETCGPLDDDQRLFGRRPTLFRPPYGSMDANTVVAAGQCGLSAVVLWDATVDRGRLRRATPGPLGPGDIILLHWGPGLAADLTVLAGVLERSGLRSALLEDYLGPRPTPA